MKLYLHALLRSFAIAILVVSASPALLALPSTNPAANARALSKEAQQRLDRSRYVDQNIAETGKNLDAVSADVLQIRRALLWSRADPSHSSRLLTAAVSDLARVPDSEGSERLKKRFDAIAGVLEDIARIEPVAAGQLEATMETIAPRFAGGNGEETQKIAQILATAALNRLQSHADPAAALKFAQASLALGGTQLTGELVREIAYVDVPTAERLARDVLASLRTNDSPALMAGFVRAAVLDDQLIRGDPAGGQFIRAAALSTFADKVLARYRQPDVDGACSYAPELAPSLPLFSPELQGQLAPVVDACQTRSDAVTVAAQISRNSLLTCDDLLRAARDQTNTPTKARLKLRAAAMSADREHDFERALDILDAMSEDERAVDRTTWYDDFSNDAASYALQLAGKRDFQHMYSVLDRTPDQSKLWVALTVIRRQRDAEDSGVALELLRYATKLLADVLPDRVMVYPMFLNESAALRPDTVPQSWKSVVAGVNNWMKKAGSQKDPWWANSARARYASLRPENISQAAVQGDGSEALAAMAELNDVNVRLSYELGVLNVLITRYEAAARPHSPKR